MAAAIAAVSAGCDEISPDDRFIHMDEIVPQRTVLLVDFTGQYCINCPEAHEVIEQLENQYGDSLVAVSVHCGDFGLPYTRSNIEANRVCLMYDEGDRLDNEYNQLASWPAGIVDMQRPSILDTGWSTAVRTALTMPPQASVVMSSSVKDETVSVTMSVSAKSYFSGSIVAWLLEDGIVAPQRNAEGAVIPDYVHNNVFRRSFTDVTGDALTLQSGETATITYTVEIKESNLEHFDHKRLKVVGFLMNDSGVLETARVNVSSN